MFSINFRYFLFALAILAVLGVSIWKAAYDKKFVLFLAGIGKMMLLFYIFTRMMHFELNLMEHSNLWISRALNLIEVGRSLIFAVGFKSSPRKTCDGRPD